MGNLSDFDRFKNLSFDDFRQLALDNKLSMYQKIGFPDSYRKDKEIAIFHDISAKLFLANVVGTERFLVDIGPGCTELPKMLINDGLQKNMKLLLIDSEQMLNQLPSGAGITKIAGSFPDEVSELINEFEGKATHIVAYSVFHYVFYHACIYKFIEAGLKMLAPGGRFLIGDIPSLSRRNRFFSTPEGVKYHQQFSGTNTLPTINNNVFGQIDDSLLDSIVNRYSQGGYHAQRLLQPVELPMSNRREDLLIIKSEL